MVKYVPRPRYFCLNGTAHTLSKKWWFLTKVIRKKKSARARLDTHAQARGSNSCARVYPARGRVPLAPNILLWKGGVDLTNLEASDSPAHLKLGSSLCDARKKPRAGEAGSHVLISVQMNPAGVPLDPSRHLSEDCALEFCRHIECGLALRRLLATCKFFQRLLRRGPNAPAEAVWEAAWLPISSSNAPHVLKHAPAGERIRILAGTTLSGQVVCGHALHVRAEPGVKLVGCLYLQGGASGSAASRGEEAIPGWLFGGLEQAREGLLEGLAISHYMEAAVLVRGGSWLLRECTITSSRRARSVTAVHLREAGCLRLERCLISNAAHAVSLDPGCCALVAAECTFERCKAAVLTHGGGCVIIERSTLNANEQALKLDDLVQVIAIDCHCSPCIAMDLKGR